MTTLHCSLKAAENVIANNIKILCSDFFLNKGICHTEDTCELRVLKRKIS